MKISMEEKPGYLLLTLGGQFDGNWALTVADKVNFTLQKITMGAPLDIDLIVDLSEVDYISSGALRILMVLHKKMKGAGRKMAICNPSARVSEVLRITGMYGFFQIQPSVKAAANSFRSIS